LEHVEVFAVIFTAKVLSYPSAGLSEILFVPGIQILDDPKLKMNKSSQLLLFKVHVQC
jgi:hypothetical protein